MINTTIHEVKIRGLETRGKINEQREWKAEKTHGKTAAGESQRRFKGRGRGRGKTPRRKGGGDKREVIRWSW